MSKQQHDHCVKTKLYKEKHLSNVKKALSRFAYCLRCSKT